MIKLWMIVLMGTHIGGVAGPLPYDMNECQRRAGELENARVEAMRSGIADDGSKIPEKNMKVFETMRFKCVEAQERPMMGGDWKE